MIRDQLSSEGRFPCPGPASLGGPIGREFMPEATKTPDAQRALMQAAGLADRARVLDDRLVALHSRLFGPTPSDPENVKPGAIAAGFFADLAAQHDIATNALLSANDTLAQIERAFP